MGLPSRRRIKKELNRRLLYYPLLRMLLFKVWFRVAFMCALVTAILLGMYLPKLWRTSPDEFNPVIRVSALDLTQAWSLKRSARKAQANGDYSRAYLSWQSAVAQNPADPHAVRGFLDNFVKLKNPDQRQVNTAMSQSLWLLRLGGTNEADVQYCASLYDKFRWHELMLYVFKPIKDDLKGPAEVAYLKALFHQGRITEFAYRLHAMPSTSDQELPLYRLALDAGWARGPEALDAHAKLRAAAESGPSAALATRLLMSAAEKRGHVESYRECLERLSRSNEASISDHTKYWALLAANGRKTEALRLAEQFASSPTSATEVLRLAEIYFKLDLIPQCREVLKTFAPQFGQSPDVWTSYGGLLENLEEWNELRAASLQIRDQPNYYDVLGGYSHYLEGRAELGHGRTTTAEMAFRKAAQASYDSSSLGMLVADGLLKAGYPLYARDVLEQLEAAKADDTEYWELVFRAAHELKDAEWLLKASEKTYAAAPGDVVLANRYAAALMTNRTRPNEAVQLTLRILNSYPRSNTAAINHALALLLNKRTAEAKAELRQLDPGSMSSHELPAYYLALFEVQMNEQAYSEARRSLERIVVANLYPPQRKWLEEQIKLLPATVTAVLP